MAEELSAAGELLPVPAIGEEAVVANAHEAGRQDVEEEAAAVGADVGVQNKVDC